LSRIESLKEFLSLYKVLIDDIDSLWSTLEKLESSKGAKMSQISEIQLKLEDKKTLLQSFYRGFFNFSLPSLVRSRALNMQKCTLAAGSYALSSSAISAQAAINLFSDLEISHNLAIHSISDPLQLAKVSPLSYISSSYAPMTLEEEGNNKEILQYKLNSSERTAPKVFFNGLLEESLRAEFKTPQVDTVTAVSDVEEHLGAVHIDDVNGYIDSTGDSKDSGNSENSGESQKEEIGEADLPRANEQNDI
jgi:hypothetical protein